MLHRCVTTFLMKSAQFLKSLYVHCHKEGLIEVKLLCVCVGVFFVALLL
uniref:Uncharacterized protein n=1 Tax=Rhizophora mucronata TaxID=61149 RepID=A0A2P2PDW0_RHIMU